MKIAGISMGGQYDGLGMAASSLCIAHCILMPLVIGLLPAVGLGFLAGERAHQYLLLSILLLAALSFSQGYQVHRRKHVLGLMAAGLGLLSFAVFAEGLLSETWLAGVTVVGGLAMVSAHWQNRSFCKSCIASRFERSCCDE